MRYKKDVLITALLMLVGPIMMAFGIMGIFDQGKRDGTLKACRQIHWQTIECGKLKLELLGE